MSQNSTRSPMVMPLGRFLNVDASACRQTSEAGNDQSKVHQVRWMLTVRTPHRAVSAAPVSLNARGEPRSPRRAFGENARPAADPSPRRRSSGATGLRPTGRQVPPTAERPRPARTPTAQDTTGSPCWKKTQFSFADRVRPLSGRVPLSTFTAEATTRALAPAGARRGDQSASTYEEARTRRSFVSSFGHRRAMKCRSGRRTLFGPPGCRAGKSWTMVGQPYSGAVDEPSKSPRPGGGPSRRRS